MEDTEFKEQFALAGEEQRGELLRNLVPNSLAYYHYNLLHLLNTDRQDTKEFKALWEEYTNGVPSGDDGEWRELLEIQKSLKGSADELGTFLKDKFLIQYHHCKQVEDLPSTYPSKMDESQLDNVIQNNLKRPNPESVFTPAAYPYLLDFNDPKLNQLVLDRMILLPTVHDRMAELIAKDLEERSNSIQFGSTNLHCNLTLEQLDQLLKLLPRLLDEPAFVSNYLSKIRRNRTDDLEDHPEEKYAIFKRLYEFIQRLSAVFNSLKALLLYNMLKFDQQQGKFDEDLFTEYLSVPKDITFPSKEIVAKQNRQNVADLSYNINNDVLPNTSQSSHEEMIHDYLSHFFSQPDVNDYKPYQLYLDEDYLRRVFAESKLLTGSDKVQNFSSLSAEAVQELKDRVDIEFLATNKTRFLPEAEVSLEVAIKNVKSLFIKIYEINTINYYQETSRNVDASISLDGLIPSEEIVQQYQEPPIKRVKRVLQFPSLSNRRGLFVIELVGNGKSSRAIVRKGALSLIERVGLAGAAFTVIDEKNRRVNGASIWFAGHLFTMNENNEILIPFSTDPSSQNIVVIKDNFASLCFVNHQRETYQLEAWINVDRENLVRGRKALVVVKPRLLINGFVTSVDILEETALLIDSTDNDGVATSKEVKPFPLFDGQESTYEFLVPENMRNIRFVVQGTVKIISQNNTEKTVTASRDFRINSQDTAPSTEEAYLRYSEKGYKICLLGKNGEPKSNRVISISLTHRFLQQPETVTLQTDEKGEVFLGSLKEVTGITTSAPMQTWDLKKLNKFSYSNSIHANANELIAVPYLGRHASLSRKAFVLIETRGGFVTHDHFNALQLKDGSLQFQLPSGTYILKIVDQDVTVNVSVVDSETKPESDYGYLVQGPHLYEYNARYVRPPYASCVETTEKQVIIKVENAHKTTRVVVTASFFVPEFDSSLPSVSSLKTKGQQRPISEFVSARQIGDEYRYILERRHAKKYPGNSLKRPSVLLTPWPVKTTSTRKQQVFDGAYEAGTGLSNACDKFLNFHADLPHPLLKSCLYAPSTPIYDFLANASITLANLHPDSAGIVKLDRDLIKGSILNVVVLDDIHTSIRTFGMPDESPQYRSTTLHGGLNPNSHFTESKLIDSIKAKTPFTIQNASSASYEIYDTLPKLYQLYSTLIHDAVLTEFDFLVKWPSFSEAQKQEKYSKYASHELNFFLYKKDRPFFNSVVKPFIACKKEKTFLDYWLIDAVEPLKRFLQLHYFTKLNNPVEWILLGQKFPSEVNNIKKLIESEFETKPVDLEQFNQVFVTALKGSALDYEEETAQAGDTFGARARAPRSMKMMMARAEPEAGELQYRRRAKVLYKAPEKTKEWAETNYYGIPNLRPALLIEINPFWREYAVHIATTPEANFLPTNISRPITYTDAIFSLAVIDLPFKLENTHSVKLTGESLEITSATPFIIFHKEIVESPVIPSSVLVSQNFFDPTNRYRLEKGENVETYVRDEFLVGKVYGCNIAVTNIGSSTQKLEVLYQIPEGAIPVENGHYTKGKYALISQYSTLAITYSFYFPKSGTFHHFPVHATKDQRVLAAATPFTFKVVEKPSLHDTSSWDYISQRATSEQVLEFLATQNISNIALDYIAWRLKDKKFFLQVTDLLRKLFRYDETIWSYGLYHNDPQVTAEYLRLRQDFVTQAGPLFVDPFEAKLFEHLEYAPLVNARAHRLGREQQILNDKFKIQYESMLNILIRKRSPNEADLLGITYYLLLQDRIDEALHFFGQITKNGDVTKHISEFQLQFDYMAAYLDLYNDNPTKAPAIAAKYVNYPVTRWNKLFKDVRDKVTSVTDTSVVVAADGKERVDDVEEDRDRELAQLAKTEPHLGLVVEGKSVKIDYENIDSCVVSYYLMDVELLFSTSPFVRQNLGRVSYVTPNKSEVVSLPADKRSVLITIPEIYRNSNVMMMMIDVQGKGIRKSAPYYSHSLNVQVLQNYGQLRVLHDTSRKPISKAYVKVYARKRGGDVSFYKDGYTDLGGVFDYSSISTDDLAEVDTFAILILSEEGGSAGAIVVEAKPPKQ